MPQFPLRHQWELEGSQQSLYTLSTLQDQAWSHKVMQTWPQSNVKQLSMLQLGTLSSDQALEELKPSV